jgi:hypothetical protein
VGERGENRERGKEGGERKRMRVGEGGGGGGGGGWRERDRSGGRIERERERRRWREDKGIEWDTEREGGTNDGVKRDMKKDTRSEGKRGKREKESEIDKSRQ